jgi:hypothetical protein
MKVRFSTHFAPAARSSKAEIEEEIRIVTAHPVVTGILETTSVLLAVLNQRRQILAVNNAFLAALQVRDPGEVLGLRPGEAIKCIHSQDMPGGCGTGALCSTCGAAIAVVACLTGSPPVEKKCVLTVRGNGKTRDLCFGAKAHPIFIRKERFILLFLQDITEQERKAGLERAFFHDLINVIMGIQGAAQLMALEKGRWTREWSERIGRMAARLQAEVAIQHALSQTAPGKYIPHIEEMSVAGLVEELREIVSHHPVARNKGFAVRTRLPRRRLKTDVSLLLRVLGNMLTNAFEATEEGGQVRFWAEAGRKAVRFCVWNRATIGPEVSPRVFQRYFSTKPGNGRGIGSFTMKLLGEEYLGGAVDFTSSAARGTVFRITLPQ